MPCFERQKIRTAQMSGLRQLFVIKIKRIRQITVVELRQDKRKPE